LNYIGRKYALIDFLDEGITSFIDPSCEIFFDVFAGTGVVGWHFKQKGFRVVANDLQYYAYCLNRASIGVNRRPGFHRVRKDVGLRGLDGTRRTLDYLDALAPRKGFIFSHYCPGGKRVLRGCISRTRTARDAMRSVRRSNAGVEPEFCGMVSNST